MLFWCTVDKLVNKIIVLCELHPKAEATISELPFGAVHKHKLKHKFVTPADTDSDSDDEGTHITQQQHVSSTLITKKMIH